MTGLSLCALLIGGWDRESMDRRSRRDCRLDRKEAQLRPALAATDKFHKDNKDQSSLPGNHDHHEDGPTSGRSVSLGQRHEIRDSSENSIRVKAAFRLTHRHTEAADLHTDP